MSMSEATLIPCVPGSRMRSGFQATNPTAPTKMQRSKIPQPGSDSVSSRQAFGLNDAVTPLPVS